MGKLKIKDGFKNKVISRHLPSMGSVKINTANIKEKDFELWQKRGLDIFEEVEEPKEEIEAVEEPKQKKTNSRKKKEVEEPKEEIGDAAEVEDDLDLD